MDIMFKVISSQEYAEFLSVSQQLRQYFKADTCEPGWLANEFKVALENYRNLLDSVGYQLPKPLWKYNKNNKKTWAFVDYKVSDKEGQKIFKEWVANPEF
jgi:transposase